MNIDTALWVARLKHFLHWFQMYPWTLWIIGAVVIFIGVLNWQQNKSGAGMVIWIVIGCALILAGLVCKFGFWG